MKIILLLFLLLNGILITKAQTNDSLNIQKADSLAVILLDEIIVSEGDNTKNPVLGFYKKTKFSTTEDVLARMPSVSLIRRGNYALEPTIRNLSAGQINVTIDGMHIFSACTDKMDPVTSYIEPNNLEAVEQESNACNGAAIGGGLNFKIKEAAFNSENSWKGTIGTEYHSVTKGTNSLFSTEFNSQKWAIRLNGSYRNHQNYETGNGEKINFSQYEKRNFSASIKHLLSSSEALKLDVVVDDAFNVGYPALPMDVKFAKAKIGSLTYQKFFYDKKIDNLEVKIYANSIDHLMDDSHREVLIRMDMPGTSKTFGGYITTEMLFGKHHISAKLDSYFNNSWADMTMFAPDEAPMYMLTWGDIDRTVTGLFIEDMIHFNKKSSLTLTARLDYASSAMRSEMGKNQHSVFGYDAENAFHEIPKNFGAKFNHQFHKNWDFAFIANISERLPSVSEQFGFYLFNSFDGYDYIGNPDIKLEKAKNFEFNFTYKKKRFNASAKFYAYFIKDYIFGIHDETLSSMTIGARGVKIYSNLPSAELFGTELQVFLKASEKITLISTMKYAHGETSLNTPMPQIAPLKNINSVQFQHKNFFLQLESEIATAQNRINEQYGEIVTPNYSIFNTKTSYTFKGEKNSLQLNFGIDNITNENYREHLDWGGIMRAGRNYYLNVNFSF